MSLNKFCLSFHYNCTIFAASTRRPSILTQDSQGIPQSKDTESNTNRADHAKAGVGFCLFFQSYFTLTGTLFLNGHLSQHFQQVKVRSCQNWGKSGVGTKYQF